MHCPSALSSRWQMVPRCRLVTLSRVFRRHPPRLVISRVVCRVLLICSRLVSRKSRRSWLSIPVRLASVRKPRASVVSLSPVRRMRYEELIPKWRHLNVFEGEQVDRGEIIADGEPNPHDILRLRALRTWRIIWLRRFRTFIVCRA